MRNESWLDAFTAEARALGMPAEKAIEATAEIDSFLVDVGGSALDHFGPPAAYAESLCMSLDHARSGPARTGAVRIEAKGVSRSFRDIEVLRDVSLSVHEGEMVALIGSNGSGKSTLLRILAGVDRPDEGQVIRSGRVGFTPQDGGLDPFLRPDEHFDVFGSAAGLGARAAIDKGRRLARELKWTDVATAPVAGKLSGGTQRKLNVVTSLLIDPEILILDEPYQGMDAESTRRFWDLLAAQCQRGAAVIMSTHQSDSLSRADRVAELPERVS